MREMGYIRIDGEKTGKHPSDIDLMLEHYPKDIQSRYMTALMLENVAIYGRIPQSPDYLVYQIVSEQPHGEITSNPPHSGLPLPDDWWEYAHVFFSDGTSKPPTKGV